jgi:hypothetical protein
LRQHLNDDLQIVTLSSTRTNDQFAALQRFRQLSEVVGLWSGELRNSRL